MAVFNFKNYLIKEAPPSVYYIPNFISTEEESHLSNSVYSVPKPKWTCLSNRRLQDYGGVPHKNGMLVEPIPKWLNTYISKVNNLKVFGEKTANHVLINEYLPGQGIMPHNDGPLFSPTVTTINCLSHTVLEFQDSSNNHAKVCHLLLEPRSLLILQDDMYQLYLHSISERKTDLISTDLINLKYCMGNSYEIGKEIDRGTRLSVTIRNVPKVAKIKLFH